MLQSRRLAGATKSVQLALSSSLRSFGASALSAEELERKYLLGNYGPDGVRLAPGLVIERGQGSILYDTKGKDYIDFFGGIAVNALGHSDKGIAEVAYKQALKIQHTSNILHTMEPLKLAETMIKHSKHFQKVFFCNSGTEANEAAMKFARKMALHRVMQKEAGLEVGGKTKAPAYTAFGCKAATPTACFTQGGTCGCWPQANNNNISMGVKNEVIAFKNSFHGRTMGALSATHKPSIRMPFAPFPADVRFARFNNLDDVKMHWNPKVGAVIVEPVQGEGGIFPADPHFMQGLKDLCVKNHALLIVDEVQCGLGRTGRLWAHEAYDVAPDIMTLAKPLAGGMPIGAVMMTDAVADCIAPGDHGTTYGGNAFVAAVAQHVFERIADPSFLAQVRSNGALLKASADKLAKKYPQVIREVRGTLDNGLFVGIDMIKPFKAVQMAAATRGLLVISAGENTIRLAPPLIITKEEITKGFELLDAAFAEAYPAPFAAKY